VGNFLIFVAPFLVLFAGLGLAFWAALQDGSISEEE